MGYTVGISGPSSASSAQSGGQFTNNAEIVFGEGIFGAQSQSAEQTATPTAISSAPVGNGGTPANSYAPNAAIPAVTASGSMFSSPVMIFGALAVGALAVIWFINR